MSTSKPKQPDLFGQVEPPRRKTPNTPHGMLRRDMTPEQLAEWHEYDRITRERVKAQMTPEERAERRAYLRPYEQASVERDRERKNANNRKSRKKAMETRPDKVRAKARERRDKNLEAFKARELKNRSKPAAKLRIKVKGAERRARERQAMPPWADKAAIAKIYAECTAISKATGIQHHVDHIVPLVGRRVSGLHIAANLRILPGSLNVKKSNRFDEHDSIAPVFGAKRASTADLDNIIRMSHWRNTGEWIIGHIPDDIVRNIAL